MPDLLPSPLLLIRPSADATSEEIPAYGTTGPPLPHPPNKTFNTHNRYRDEQDHRE
ncbi:MAG: hypothetical protein VX633_07830 [Verrucomicrobiota bacterium]|nr:hypothetical protein [Verrucomicrobiota bacterium]